MRMRCSLLNAALGVWAVTAFASWSWGPALGGDNIEVVTGGATVISHKLWHVNAFPLAWKLHEDGVVNNDAVGAGTPALTNADVGNAISAAFQEWQDVAISTITVTFAGETPTGDSGCDLENIITWSDTVETFASTVIAKGLTTSYVGPPFVLNDTNRTLPCGAVNVTLPASGYPNGTSLAAGTILDMDMTWNAADFDYVTTPNATSSVLDIRAVASHEFGHMFGFSHSSLAFAGSDPVTMFPIVSSTDVTLQTNMRSLELDDQASSGRGYPGPGFFPGGGLPATTGVISGRVSQPDGTGAQGVRVWAYDTSDTSQPIYETFTATSFDWDTSLQPGDYVLDGLQSGKYFVCIVAWQNGVPTAQAANELRYNLTTGNASGHTGFGTECYDDAQSATSTPDFATTDLIRPVSVTAGLTMPGIDFVTGAGTTDFVLVMDRSGSMTLPSGTPGKTKLEALQDAAKLFVDFLDLAGNHKLGLVQFEESLVPLTPVIALQPLDAAAAQDAHSAIDTMSAGGWTNIIAGANEANDQLTSIGSPSPRQG